MIYNYRIALLFTTILISCSSGSNNQYEEIINDPVEIKVHMYEEMEFPSFMKQLYENHYGDYHVSSKPDFINLCNRYELDSTNEQNQHTFYAINFYHQLFTGDGSFDGSSEGGILKIPYFWNWVEPNRRDSIMYLPTNEYLSEITPPKRFSRYNSFADIDRIPSLYIQDLLTSKPSYHHEYCGDFYTFGWCSEREMTFVLLMELLLDIPSVVIVEGAHSWTEMDLKFVGLAQDYKEVRVKVDNTYDDIEFGVEPSIGDQTNDVIWYNYITHSEEELESVKQMIVSEIVAERIDEQVIFFLN